MKITIAILGLLIVASPVQAGRECDLDALKAEIKWCLIEAPEDIMGRKRMVEALHRERTLSDIFQFRVGFAACHERDLEKLSNFLECRRDDPAAILNFGRELIGLPPMSTATDRHPTNADAAIKRK
jgi:hypothetical protein